MAATVLIRRLWGAGPTATDITSGNNRASTYDDTAPGTSWPIPIPGSGSKFSYWVTTRLDATVTPAGTIDNIRWYTDGTNSYGTGVSYRVAECSYYIQATGTPGDTGTELTQGNHAGCLTDAVDGFTYTTGSPLAVDGSISNPSTGQFGNMVVAQIEVFAAAGAGEITDETMTYKFDET